MDYSCLIHDPWEFGSSFDSFTPPSPLSYRHNPKLTYHRIPSPRGSKVRLSMTNHDVRLSRVRIRQLKLTRLSNLDTIPSFILTRRHCTSVSFQITYTRCRKYAYLQCGRTSKQVHKAHCFRCLAVANSALLIKKYLLSNTQVIACG